ncbi:hypothetical protein [Paenibacillus silvisoli]|uniref:hypothetical protein n=1 Tax=Paenibacillus silvisoli TaxID=3110539 RepID=UPI002805B5AE|nr:hypothetical protein [Paenibacillus silvisoli]
MKKYLITLIVALLTLQMLIVQPQSASACSCAFVEPKEAIEKADAIFIGTLMEVKQERKQEGIVGPILNRDANLFDVSTVFKGINQSQIIIYDNGEEASCGIDLAVGESYLVYVYANKEGEYYTSLCSRTMEASKAGEDLKLLGEGKAPEKKAELGSKMKRISNKDYDMEFAVGAVALAIAAAFLILRRRKKS